MIQNEVKTEILPGCCTGDPAVRNSAIPMQMMHHVRVPTTAELPGPPESRIKYITKRDHQSTYD
jgi:hypothetical protein